MEGSELDFNFKSDSWKDLYSLIRKFSNFPKNHEHLMQ